MNVATTKVLLTIRRRPSPVCDATKTTDYEDLSTNDAGTESSKVDSCRYTKKIHDNPRGVRLSF